MLLTDLSILKYGTTGFWVPLL